MKADRKDEDFLPPMPDVDAHDQLIQYLWEAGPVMGGGEPLSQTEIHYWQRNTGRVLSGWEAQTLRDLSIQYLGQVEASKAPNCPSPYAASPGLTRAQIAAKTARMFQQAMAAQAKRLKRMNDKGAQDESRHAGD